MDRRRFIGTVSGALLPASLVARAQQPVKVARIGVLSVVWTRQTNPILSGLLTGLRDLGYVEGQTIVIEYRAADGQVERMRWLAAELVGLKVDVIVAVATPSIQAAKEATATIPIVMAFSGGDPVQSGFVTTLSRPGGNVTGLTLLASLSTKRMELVKDALPGLHVVAVLANPGNASNPQQLQGIQTAAQSLRLRIQVLQVRVPSELRTAFLETSEEAGALVVLADPMLFAELQQILDLAATRRLPVFSDWKEMAEAGGLVAYGPNLNLLARRAATYVDKILKGANPGDLPIEQPTKFELVINMKTAKALGLTIPQSLLLRADEVIQ